MVIPSHTNVGTTGDCQNLGGNFATRRELLGPKKSDKTRKYMKSLKILPGTHLGFGSGVELFATFRFLKK
jgi:hypothetical protein